MPDCRLQPGETSPTLRWFVIAVKPSESGEGGEQGGATARLLKSICQKYIKMSFFDVM
jgi:hypothetical protein